MKDPIRSHEDLTCLRPYRAKLLKKEKKKIINKDPLFSTGKYSVITSMGEGSEKEWISVHVLLNHLMVLYSTTETNTTQ